MVNNYICFLAACCLYWGEAVHRHDASIDASKKCNAVCFGHSKFHTLGFGSNVALLMAGTNVAQEKGLHYIRFSNHQIQQLSSVFNPALLRRVVALTPEGQGCSLEQSRCIANMYDMVHGIHRGGPNSKWVLDARLQMIRYFRPSLRSCSDHSSYSDPETLVMHMRSGDVFEVRNRTHALKHEDHAQPPCAFYRLAFEQGNNGGPFKKGVIITQVEGVENHLNPCAHEMVRLHPEIELHRGTFQQDTCALLHARNLALSKSAYPATMVQLNVDIKNLYVPMDQSVPWYNELSWVNGSMPYTQHLYSIDAGYNWRESMRERKLPVRHRMNVKVGVTVQTIPAMGSSGVPTEIHYSDA